MVAVGYMSLFGSFARLGTIKNVVFTKFRRCGEAQGDVETTSQICQLAKTVPDPVDFRWFPSKPTNQLGQPARAIM